MTAQVVYSHAAPVLREKLIRAVYASRTAAVARDRREAAVEAWTYADALLILAHSADGQPAPGIFMPEALPLIDGRPAVEVTREWLGRDADAVLGASDAAGAEVSF